MLFAGREFLAGFLGVMSEGGSPSESPDPYPVCFLLILITQIPTSQLVSVLMTELDGLITKINAFYDSDKPSSAACWSHLEAYAQSAVSLLCGKQK